MQTLLGPLHDHLIQQGLIVHALGDGEGLFAHVTLEHLRMGVAFCINGPGGGLTIEGSLPVPAPIDRRPAVAEFLTRINWNLRRGLFLMDFSDGEIRFRCENGKHEGPVDLNDAETGLRLCCRMVDAFFPALMSVIYRDTQPEEALVQAEKDHESLTKEKEKETFPRETTKWPLNKPHPNHPNKRTESPSSIAQNKVSSTMNRTARALANREKS